MPGFNMAQTLSCYYIDEPLAEDELQFVEQALLGPWAKFKTQASSIAQKRVPLVLPTPAPDGSYAETPEQRAQHVRGNLRHVGIRADAGIQVVWVMPRDTQWGAIFQFAIHEETGFAPFVVQRWFLQNGQLARGSARVVNAHMLLQGL